MAREKEKQEKTKEEHFGVTAASAARIFFYRPKFNLIKDARLIYRYLYNSWLSRFASYRAASQS
jgi:hypothetical protein